MGIWVIGTLAVSLGLTIVLEETFEIGRAHV